MYNADLRDFAIWYDPPRPGSTMTVLNNGHTGKSCTLTVTQVQAEPNSLVSPVTVKMNSLDIRVAI